MPVLNEAGTIEQTLQSLQILRSRGCEVIVVDGGSSDATISLAQPWVDCVIDSRAGRAVQMNLGAAQAGGEILLFLHADTRLPAQADQLIIDGLSASGCIWGRFNVCLSGKRLIFRVVEKMMNIRSRFTGIATGDQALFITTQSFKSVGGFPAIALMEDIAMSHLLRQHSRPLCLSESVLTSSRRWEKKGVFRTIVLMWYLRMRFFLGADPETLHTIY